MSTPISGPALHAKASTAVVARSPVRGSCSNNMSSAMSGLAPQSSLAEQNTSSNVTPMSKKPWRAGRAMVRSNTTGVSAFSTHSADNVTGGGATHSSAAKGPPASDSDKSSSVTVFGLTLASQVPT